MEINEKRIVELFMGLVFVALLIIILLIVVYFPSQKSAGQSVIQNSYNVNSYNSVTLKTVEESREDSKRNYVKETRFLRYSSYGEHIKERGFFNDYKDEFNVYVVNKDYVGGYFRVRFYFCDYYKNCFSESIEKYIPAKKEARFNYFDVQGEKYRYYDWEYEVFPEEID